MRIMTVIMNPIPRASATSLRRFFSIIMFPAYLVADDRSSDVIRSMIAITASQRLISFIESGKFIFTPP